MQLSRNNGLIGGNGWPTEEKTNLRRPEEETTRQIRQLHLIFGLKNLLLLLILELRTAETRLWSIREPKRNIPRLCNSRFAMRTIEIDQMTLAGMCGLSETRHLITLLEWT
jgi:hypothetical protein